MTHVAKLFAAAVVYASGAAAVAASATGNTNVPRRSNPTAALVAALWGSEGSVLPLAPPLETDAGLCQDEER